MHSSHKLSPLSVVIKYVSNTEMRNTYKIFVGQHEGTGRYLGYRGVNGSIILKCRSIF
jgi:hypothetical protein